VGAREWQPTLTIDPGPYDAVIVCWGGRCVTVLGGSRQLPPRVGADEKPVKVPVKVRPPVTSRLMADQFLDIPVADALQLAPPEVSEQAGPDIPPEHFPVWYEGAGEEREPAVPTENRNTFVRAFAGTNYIDLDEHRDLFEQAQRAGADILIRFT